jgi:hypothetical protein
MQEDTERHNSTAGNPYIGKPPSYKDALLSDAQEESNRIGINTFKLIHLIQKGQNTADDDMSVSSDATNPKTNTTTLTSFRMRFQTTLYNTTSETYMEDLSQQINEIMEIVNVNTPGVRLAPWHSEDIKDSQLIMTLSDSPIDAVKYLYGFKAGGTRSGTQYFRIRLVFPTSYTPDDIVNKNKGSIMIMGKQSLLKANSQSINPTVVGWFFRSNPTMVDFDDLEKVLKTLWTVKHGFGLYWASVKDGKPYDASTTARAVHIETEESQATKIGLQAEKLYGKASKKVEDYPLGMNMMFVKQYGDVKGSAKALVAKLAAYQKKHEQVMESASWFGEIALDRSIVKDGFRSLRQWLLNLKSLHPKLNKDKKQYFDNVFTSIHRDTDGQEVKFYFSKVNETEASNIILALPLIIRDELNLDPSCFMHRSDVANTLEGAWDPTTRVYKNKNMMNQEQYMEDMDDFFHANNCFLGQTVEVATPIPSGEVQKHTALVNGEDDVSMLSNLTDKTLQEANKTGEGSAYENQSVQSGMTSRSKTQLAVKEALQAVSLEHKKALQEQQKSFNLNSHP